MKDPEPVTIACTLGSRRLLRFDRYLTDIAYSLDDLIHNRRPPAPDVCARDGLRILSAPLSDIAHWRTVFPRHRFGAVQHYRRHYIAMQGDFDTYLSQFSGKTRSTLRRKQRRFEDAGGGALDVRCYRGEREIAEFLDLAAPLARRTYQARLLDAALPADAQSQRAMRDAARRDEVRAFLLFLQGKPVAYLYLPIAGTTVIYAYLGYDSEHGELSPGTVLQMSALEQLFAEQRFTMFDFTEGDGGHKALFGTDCQPCCSFLLLQPTWQNRAVLATHDAFDRGVEQGKRLLVRFGAEQAARRILGR